MQGWKKAKWPAWPHMQDSKIENPRAVLFRNRTWVHQVDCTSFRCAPIEYTATALQNIAPQGQKCRMENAQFAKHFKSSLDNLLLVRLLMWAPFKGFWSYCWCYRSFWSCCGRWAGWGWCSCSCEQDLRHAASLLVSDSVSPSCRLQNAMFLVFLQFLIEHSAADIAEMKWSLLMMQDRNE